MIEIQDILDQEPIGTKRRDEQFIDPLPDTLAYWNVLPWRRSGMPGHNHAHVRRVITQLQPAAIKQLDDLTAVHPRHARRRRMSQHELDLGTLQELIASPARHEIRACQQKLSDDGRIAILSVETDQSHLWWESEVLQIGRDGSER